jgi:hypothetical protein
MLHSKKLNRLANTAGLVFLPQVVDFEALRHLTLDTAKRKLTDDNLSGTPNYKCGKN